MSNSRRPCGTIIPALLMLLLQSGLHSARAEGGLALDAAAPQAAAYSPFAGERAFLPIEIETRGTLEGSNAVRLVLQPSAGRLWRLDNALGQGAEYILSGLDGLRRDGDRFVADLAPQDGVVRASLFAEVEALTFLTPGQYLSLVDIVLLDPQTNIELARRDELQIAMSVKGEARVGLGGGDSQLDPTRTFTFIDFGVLAPGKTRNVFVTVRANTETQIIVASENRGSLVHEEYPEGRIPYNVDLDGERAQLTAPLTVVRTPAQKIQGTSYPMVIEIGQYAGARAGRYTDFITVDVIPQ